MVRKFFAVAIIFLCCAVPATAATVTLTWDPNPEPDVAGYVVFYGTASGQYTASADIGNQTSFQIALADSTTRYYFAVCAYNASGIRSALSTEVTTTYTPTLVTSLRPSVPTPQIAGTPVTFTAAATSDAGPAQFKWWILDGGGTTWRIAQDWSTSNAFRWIPGSANDYDIAVWARNPASTADAPDSRQAVADVTFSITNTSTPLVTSLRASVPAPQVAGTPVTFTAAAAGGTGPAQFKWWIMDGGSTTWKIAQDWSTSNAFRWIPTNANDYVVAVWARNSTSTTDAPDNRQAVAFVNFSITQSLAPLALTDLHANVPSPQLLGTSITFVASAAGGIGPYQYKWLTSNGSSWNVAQNWSSTNTFAWTPTQASATSSVGVWVRSATSTADAPDNAASGTTMTFVITDVTNVTLTANKAAPQMVGSKIQFTATVQGSGVYQYKWWIFAGGAWVPVQEWSAGNTFYWAPTTPYPNGQVLVRVRQASNPSNTGGVSIPFPIIRPSEKHSWR